MKASTLFVYIGVILILLGVAMIWKEQADTEASLLHNLRSTSNVEANSRPDDQNSEEIRDGRGVCDMNWTLTTPFAEPLILRNYFTPVCISQPGLHGIVRMVLNSTTDKKTLEYIEIPIYKGKGCSLIAGRLPQEPTFSLSFIGCSVGEKIVRVMDIECGSNRLKRDKALSTSCVRDGHSPDFSSSIVILSAPATVSDVRLDKGKGPSLFTHSSVEQLTIGSEAMLTVNKSVIDQHNTWFALYAGFTRSHSLLRVINCSVSLRNSTLVSHGRTGAVITFENSRVQIAESEFTSQGTMTQLHFINTFSLLYRIHSIAGCKSLKSSSAKDIGINLRFDGYFYSVLRPVIWRSSLVNWCTMSSIAVRSPYKLRLFESLIEQSQSITSSVFLQDVFEFSPSSMLHAHDTMSSTAKPSRMKKDVWHIQTATRINPHRYLNYTFTEFRRSMCTDSFNYTSYPDAVQWLARMACERNRIDPKFLTHQYGDCPQPVQNSSLHSGTEHRTYLGKINYFHVMIRTGKRGGQARTPSGVGSLFHPSMAFRLGDCVNNTSGKGLEVYRTVAGEGVNRAKKELPLDEIYNLALDMTEAFAYLHYGRPQGGLRHGDFAVGYFQANFLSPLTKNVMIDYTRQMVQLFDFDNSFRGVTNIPYNWTLTKGMRQDIQGLGFAIWSLVGIRLHRVNIETEVNWPLIQQCSPSLRELCRVASKCIDARKYRFYDTIAVFDQIVESIPKELYRYQ